MELKIANGNIIQIILAYVGRMSCFGKGDLYILPVFALIGRQSLGSAALRRLGEQGNPRSKTRSLD